MSNPSLVVRLVIDGKEFTGGVADAQKRLAALGQAGQVSAAQTAAAWRTVPAQFTDIVTQLQGGASPATVLLQQGGQMKDSFGGIAPMFKELATLITPVNVALGVTGLALGGVALAAFQGRQEASALARSLQLTGNFAATSGGQFTALARDVANASGVTVGTSRELLQAAVATGEVGPRAIGPVTTAMATLAKVSNATAQDVAADFASMSRNVTAWAVEHNRQYNFLAQADYDRIKSLTEHGRAEEAMALTAEKLTAVLKSRQAELGWLETAWNSVAQAASKAWDSMKGVGRPDSAEDQLARAKAGLQRAMDAPASDRFYDPDGKQVAGRAAAVAAYRARVDQLTQSIYAQGEAEAHNAAAAAANKRKIEDDASGKSDVRANAGIDKQLADERTASAAMLSVIDSRQQRLDAANKAGLLAAQDYAQQRVELIQRETAERQALITREIELENQRPGSSPEQAAQRAAKVATMEGQRSAAAIDGAKRIAQAQIDADLAVLESARTRAQAWADAWKSAHDQVRAAQDANADRAITLIQDPQAQERARAARLNELAQRKLSEALPDLQRGLASAPNDGAREALQQQINDLSRSTAEAIELNNRELAEKLKPQWQRNLEAWRDNNRLMRESWDELMNRVQQDGEDAFVQLMQSGKISIKSLVDDALAQFARMQYRQWMAKVGGIGGLLDSGLSWLGSLGTRATGGPTSAGGLYLVGESGPELLRMGTSGGNVIPAQSVGRVLAAAAPAAASSVSLSMPANVYIDARSDQAQVGQAVATGMAVVEKRMWAAMRVRGLVKG